MKKIFKNRKYVKADYEPLKLLIVFKKISKKKVLELKISKLELNSREKRAYILNKKKYYFNSSRRFFNSPLKSFLFIFHLLITRFTFLIIYNILKFI